MLRVQQFHYWLCQSVNASFQNFWEQSFFNFSKILFTDSPIFTDFYSDNLMTEITYFIINYFIKSFDLVGQVLLSSLTNTVSSRKLFLNFLPLRNICPDFFCVYLFVRDKPFSESICASLSLFSSTLTSFYTAKFS